MLLFQILKKNIIRISTNKPQQHQAKTTDKKNIKKYHEIISSIWMRISVFFYLQTVYLYLKIKS